MTIANTLDTDVDIFIGGGTVTLVQLKRQSTSFDVGLLGGSVRLSPGDQTVITYAVAPTITRIRR